MKKQAYVLKLGGSTLDHEFEKEPIVGKLVDPIVNLTAEFDVFLNPGGGPAWDPRKQWRIRYKTPDKMFCRFSRETLSMNAAEICLLFGDKASVIHPDRAFPVANDGRDIVRIFYWAPEILMERLSEEPWHSDLQTLAVAQALSDSYQDVFVGFIKRTDGIHFWDASLSPEQLLDLLAKVSAEKQEFYRNVAKRCRSQAGHTAPNPRLPVVATSELLAGNICRLGRDEQDDHVIELAVIRYLHEQATGVRHVGVVRHTHVSLLAEMARGPVEEHEYSIIRRGSESAR